MPQKNRTACREVDGAMVCRLYEAGGCDFLSCESDVNRRCQHCDTDRRCDLEDAWPGSGTVPRERPEPRWMKGRKKRKNRKEFTSVKGYALQALCQKLR
jgi:hypothetical protein